MKASLLGSILFVTLATAAPMGESNPTPGAAMDMAMKRDMGMAMNTDTMPSAGHKEAMDMKMGMKRDMAMDGVMDMDNMPATDRNDPTGMDRPMAGKGQLPGMDMDGMQNEGDMKDRHEGMNGNGAGRMAGAGRMPGMDMGMDGNMGEGMMQ